MSTVCLAILAAASFSFVLLCANARMCAAAEGTHPVYPIDAGPDRVSRLERIVAPLMGMTEEKMTALVPDRTGFRFVGCPACDAGAQEGQLTWSIEDPHRVKCGFCGTVFPNADFPEDKVLRVVNPVGVEVEYPMWEDETGFRYPFSAKAWRQARTYFSSRAEDFGELYQMTGERQYARRAALILDAFARYYPGFLVSMDQPHGLKSFVMEPPYPNTGGKWGRWRHDEMPTDLVFAYDSIYSSGELERLTGETGVDVKARIENDLFRGAIQQDRHHGILYTNASPRIYEGYAAIGRVVGDPALVHEAVQRSVGLFERQFYEDGFWSEGSVGYHAMTLKGMARVFRSLRGYTDPPGYRHPETGTRLDDLDLERDIPVIRRAQEIPKAFRYPDGRGVPAHDMFAARGDLDVQEKSVSTLFRGVGHAWLGAGSGENQIQAHLHFSGGYGHEHADNLSLALFAKGQELLPDLGYTHTRHRAWSTSTLCHNTVSVDEQRQITRGRGSFSDGRLVAFDDQWDVAQWMEAAGERAYPDLVETYRRGLLLVRVGETDAYVVDIFRVKGGSQHDWAIHGSADVDGTVNASVPTAAFGENLLPGVPVRFPAGERDRGDAGDRNLAYAYFQNVTRGTVDEGVVLSFGIDGEPAGLRTHLPGLSDGEVFLGDALSIRRADEDEALIDQYRMPIALLRRTGQAPLESVFVAVHEPFIGDTFIDSVNVRRVGDGGTEIVVKHGETTDHILLGEGDAGTVISFGPGEMIGDAGFVRERAGEVVQMALWGGTKLRWAGTEMTGSGILETAVEGTVRRAEGDESYGLIVEGPLPEGEEMKGAIAIIQFGDGTTRGCRVQEVRRTDDRYLVVLADDPGFSMTSDGAEHAFFPHRKMPGSVVCRIRSSAMLDVARGELHSVGGARYNRD